MHYNMVYTGVLTHVNYNDAGEVYMQHERVQKLTISALLVAIGILIPIISPVKIILEPASFTLGSHVAIFIALFISPMMAVSVALGTTVGFLISGFPLVISLRALTHVLFAGVGAYWLQKDPGLMNSPIKTQLYSLMIGILHAVAEVLVIALFYFGGTMTEADYSQGFLRSVFLMVGVGTVIHSMVDFSLAHIVWKALNTRQSFVAKMTKLRNNN